jgi:hypothetical protein
MQVLNYMGSNMLIPEKTGMLSRYGRIGKHEIIAAALISGHSVLDTGVHGAGTDTLLNTGSILTFDLVFVAVSSTPLKRPGRAFYNTAEKKAYLVRAV